jgi:hypothetical protein
MTEGEKRFNPEDPDLVENITAAYDNSSPEEFMDYLKQFHKLANLNLEVHASGINVDSINYLMANFPHAKVEITADPEDYEKMKPVLPISVEWKLLS